MAAGWCTISTRMCAHGSGGRRWRGCDQACHLRGHQRGAVVHGAAVHERAELAHRYDYIGQRAREGAAGSDRRVALSDLTACGYDGVARRGWQVAQRGAANAGRDGSKGYALCLTHLAAVATHAAVAIGCRVACPAQDGWRRGGALDAQ